MTPRTGGRRAEGRRAPTWSSCWCTRARRTRERGVADRSVVRFGKIVNGADSDIDAIISGHTHLAYNHAIPVPDGGDGAL